MNKMAKKENKYSEEYHIIDVYSELYYGSFIRGKKAKLYFNKEEIDNCLISWKKMRERFNR
jgi:hypothetical protein